MVRLHSQFEWDEGKAETNLKTHGISFDLAINVLEDPDGDRFHLDDPDDSHADGEDRFLTIGSTPGDRRVVLVICWTDRSTDDEQVTRIIGARKADEKERTRHAERLGG